MAISDVLLDEGGAFHNVKAAEFGAVGNGSMPDQQAFEAADAKGHILVPAGVYFINSPLTISHAVRFVDGAVLRPANGVTITLDGAVEAGLYKIFDLPPEGAVTFGSNSVEKVYPQWWGAVGDGDTDDADAIQAAVDAAAAVGGTVLFPAGQTHLVSRTIRGARGIHWQFNDTTLNASSGGTYDDIVATTGPTGLKVFFATDRGLDSVHSGKLTINGNGVSNLCGISGSDDANEGAGRGNQTWEWVQITNCARGIFALNQEGGVNRTLIGHHFGFVQFLGCDVDLWVEDNGADDTIFNVVRSRSAVDGSTGVFLDGMRGLTINVLFIRSQSSPAITRTGVQLEGGASLICDHLYLEGPFSHPILVRDSSCLLVRDVKVSNATTSTDGNLISVPLGGSPAAVVDVTINWQITTATGLTHLVRIQSAAASTAGRTVVLRIPSSTTAKTPFVYTGTNPSQNDYVVVHARNGTFRYFYDGSTLTTLREPLVNGGTAAASTLGNVARRMEVFDANGNSLGFVPIYDSIT